MLGAEPGDARSGDRGFTLVELLIVVVILALLGAIVVFALSSYTSAAATASCESDLKTAQVAVLAYRAQMGNYPDGSTSGGSGIQTDTDLVTVDAAGAKYGEGSELLTGSEVGPSGRDASGVLTPNLSGGTGSGAWLKDVPLVAGHFYLWAANDGSGNIYVGTGAFSAAGPAPAATDCSAVK
jgi:general secretion pathway protein G